MDKNKFVFSKINYILLSISVCLKVIGFILMSGGGSTEAHYDPNIFSTMKIHIAPAISFIGFIFVIVAIMYKPKTKKEN